MKYSLFVVCLIAVQAFAHQQVTLQINSTQVHHYLKKGDDYIATSADVAAVVSFDGETSEGPLHMKQEANVSQPMSVTLSNIQKNSVEMNNMTAPTFQGTLNASVDRSFFTKKLKSLTIPSSEILKATGTPNSQYTQWLKVSMGLDDNQINLNVDIQSSDYRCIATEDSEKLDCHISNKVTISASEK